jgi:hypothetical protein
MNQSNPIIANAVLVAFLTFTFTALKLCHIISWSWWWVTSPLWIAAGILLLLAIPYCMLLFIYRREIRENKKNKK